MAIMLYDTDILMLYDVYISHTHYARNAITGKLNSDMLNSMDCYCSYEAEPVLKHIRILNLKLILQSCGSILKYFGCR